MYASRGVQARGVYPVLLRAVFAELGVGLELIPLPWVRALNGLDRAEHGVGGLYANAERLAKFDYGQALMVETVRLYVQRGGLRQFNHLADLKGMRVGVLRGWSYGDEFDQARKAGLFSVEVVSTDKQNFGKLERDFLDAVLAVEQTGDGVLAGGDFPSVRMLSNPLTENPSHLAFHKSAGQTTLLARVDAVIARLRASGEHARLIARGLRD
jgi:polar amino acid transport system substrate-binding protein